MSKIAEFIAQQAQKESYAWMNKAPHPMPTFKHNEIVLVRRNGNWAKAKVLTSSPVGCSVQFVSDSKAMNLYDARCVRSSQDRHCL